MIGFDALPMTEPRNYRFPPNMAPYVSDYFRQLASADRVVCISEHAREEMWSALRRPMNLMTEVAHPGGDHLAVNAPASTEERITFLRLGTLEARKMPVEILQAFVEADLDNAELIFIGGPNSSDESINSAVRAAIDSGAPVKWIQGASDQEVRDHVAAADMFLAIVTEGYGIPVLEAIALGTPVLYSGIQPAAEIMDSVGATRLPGHTHGQLVEMFRGYSRAEKVAELRGDIDTSAIPQWKAFVDVVARACKSY
jgi:glycosyltransferase involved in cell wall biosynthesis